VLRWINLGLALGLATLLLVEFTQSRQSRPPVPAISEGPPVVAQEKPGRRSRRMEARMAIEEAKRQRRARVPSSAPMLLDESGRPFTD
jgi:hypothetical protein